MESGLRGNGTGRGTTATVVAGVLGRLGDGAPAILVHGLGCGSRGSGGCAGLAPPGSSVLGGYNGLLGLDGLVVSDLAVGSLVGGLSLGVLDGLGDVVALRLLSLGSSLLGGGLLGLLLLTGLLIGLLLGLRGLLLLLLNLPLAGSCVNGAGGTEGVRLVGGCGGCGSRSLRDCALGEVQLRAAGKGSGRGGCAGVRGAGGGCDIGAHLGPPLVVLVCGSRLPLVLWAALGGLELAAGSTLALGAALTPCRGLPLAEATFAGLTWAVEAPTAFPGCLGRGRKRALALPVAKVALLAVALEGGASALAAVAAGVRGSSIEATAAVAASGTGARVGKVGEGALARPVGDVPGFRAVLGCVVLDAAMSMSGTVHTGLSNADADVSALELRAGEVEGLLQAIECAELDVAEALGLAVELVLDDAHVGDLAAGEEVGDVALGRVEGEVAQVGGVRGLRGEGELLAGSKAAVRCETCQRIEQADTALHIPKLSVRAPKPLPPP